MINKLTLSKINNLKSKFILNNPHSKLSTLSSSDIRNLAVIWTYYSAKIEGNTYTYVETEALLVEDISSPKKYSFAKELKNLFNTFISVIQDINSNNFFEIDEITLCSLQARLTADLIDDSSRGVIRTGPVKVRGVNYIPVKEKIEIRHDLSSTFYELSKIENPLEKAIFAHLNLAKIQPFYDGNKRTARVIESIILMQNNLIPIYSQNEADILKYKNGIVSFYEQGDYSIYSDYFLNSQINRIEEVSLKSQPNWNDFKKQELSKNKGLLM